MPRRLIDNSRPGDDRWVLSYADFITLLFALFVVMYAVSSVNEEKYQKISDALSDRFINIEPEPADIRPQTPDILNSGFQPGQESVNSGISKYGQSSLPEGGSSELEKLLSPLAEKGLVRVSNNKLWLEIELQSGLLFDSGRARLSGEADMLLEQLATVLNTSKSPVSVEGYTDNIPVHSDRFSSNWELSAARAATVARVLAEFGVEPRRLVASGYGEHRPLYSNRTEQGRLRNRRVMLVVARDQSIRRLVSAYGGELLSNKSIGEMLKQVPQEAETTPVIEQTETERGGILYRQADVEAE